MRACVPLVAMVPTAALVAAEPTDGQVGPQVCKGVGEPAGGSGCRR